MQANLSHLNGKLNSHIKYAPIRSVVAFPVHCNKQVINYSAAAVTAIVTDGRDRGSLSHDGWFHLAIPSDCYLPWSPVGGEPIAT